MKDCRQGRVGELLPNGLDFDAGLAMMARSRSALSAPAVPPLLLLLLLLLLGGHAAAQQEPSCATWPAAANKP